MTTLTATTTWTAKRTEFGTEYIKGSEEAEDFIKVRKNVDGFNTFSTGWTFTGTMNGDAIEDDGMTRFPTAKELMALIDEQVEDWS